MSNYYSRNYFNFYNLEKNNIVEEILDCQPECLKNNSKIDKKKIDNNLCGHGVDNRYKLLKNNKKEFIISKKIYLDFVNTK